MRALRLTLYVIGVFQFALGAAFLVAPVATPHLLGLHPAVPAWANWLLAMMAGRFLGYGYGMFAAAREPGRHHAWIDTMIVVQAIDWTATIAYLTSGHLTLSQVTTAAFMPVIFIAVLAWYRLAGARRTTTAGTAAAAEDNAVTR